MSLLKDIEQGWATLLASRATLQRDMLGIRDTHGINRSADEIETVKNKGCLYLQ